MEYFFPATFCRHLFATFYLYIYHIPIGPNSFAFDIDSFPLTYRVVVPKT